MFLSIIVPMYNVSEYIDRCLNSLVNQNIDDYEIIVVNDASVDDSLIKAQKWENLYQNLKVINKEKNSGLSDTRNKGLKEATGKYILFVDSDDYIDTNSLYQLKSELMTNEPDILYFGYWVVTKEKTEKIYNYKSKQKINYFGHDFIKNELINRNLPIPACVACYRRTLITDNNLYFATGILHEDVRWSPEILYKANKVYTSSLCFYRYIIRNSSISQKKTKKNGRDLLDTCDYLIKFSKVIDDWDLRKFFINYIAMTYMKAVAVNNLMEDQIIKVENTFPLRYVNNYKDRIKAILFAISPTLYSHIYIFIKVKIKGDIL